MKNCIPNGGRVFYLLAAALIWLNGLAAGVPEETTITLPGDVPLVLVRVPAESFLMGSPSTERSRQSDEGPTHTVNMAYDFHMGKYELTQQQWLALMGTWPDFFASPPNKPEFGVGDDYPAYYISGTTARTSSRR